MTRWVFACWVLLLSLVVAVPTTASPGCSPDLCTDSLTPVRLLPQILDSPASRVLATTQVLNNLVDYTFAQNAVFRLELESSEPITEVWLSVQAPDSSPVVMPVSSPLSRRPVLSYTLDLQTYPLPPFTTIRYWWRVQGITGVQDSLPVQHFVYRDNRFDWQELHSPALVAGGASEPSIGVDVYWVPPDPGLGSLVVDTVNEALPRLSEQVGVRPARNIQVYIYPTLEALQSTLRLTGRTWVAGHTDPELGVVLLALKPGLDQTDSLLRDTRHELTHVLVYQASQGHTGQVPVWLNEGLAVTAEGPLNPDYAVVLERFGATGKLLLLANLCASFPDDPSQAELAYAQSASLVRFLREHYGNTALRDLVASYLDGAACEAVPERVLGLGLAELDRAWRSGLERSQPLTAVPAQWGPVLPWLLLLVLGTNVIVLPWWWMARRAAPRTTEQGIESGR